MREAVNHEMKSPQREMRIHIHTESHIFINSKQTYWVTTVWTLRTMWPVGEAATGHTYWWAVPGMLISQRHRGTLEREKNVRKLFLNFFFFFLVFFLVRLRNVKYANKPKITSTTKQLSQNYTYLLHVSNNKWTWTMHRNQITFQMFQII